MNAFLTCALLSLAAVLSTGCSLLGKPRGGVASYAPVLSPATTPAASDRRTRTWQIEVAEPQTPSSLFGTHILVSPEPGRVEVYRDARWQDPPALLLQALLIQGLGESGVAGAAGSASLQHADFLLESDLLRLQAEYRGEIVPTAAIGVYVRLVRVADGRVIAARRFSVDEAATASPVPCVVEAFGRAIDHLVRDMAAWAVAAGDQAWEPPPG
ncbi:MAG: hypothetical protein AMXMBFR59_26010 [Rhodanobacteraceae bacterium]